MKGIGLRYALRGVGTAVRRERNLRIHLTAAFFVTVYAAIGRVEGWAWAVILVCFGLVLGLELMNSAVEGLANRVTTEREHQIAEVKDMSAGGVLMAAVCAAGVAVCVFARQEVWEAVIADRLSYIALITLPFGVWFIKGKKTWK